MTDWTDVYVFALSEDGLSRSPLLDVKEITIHAKQGEEVEATIRFGNVEIELETEGETAPTLHGPRSLLAKVRDLASVHLDDHDELGDLARDILKAAPLQVEDACASFVDLSRVREVCSCSTKAASRPGPDHAMTCAWFRYPEPKSETVETIDEILKR